MMPPSEAWRIPYKEQCATTRRFLSHRTLAALRTIFSQSLRPLTVDTRARHRAECLCKAPLALQDSPAQKYSGSRDAREPHQGRQGDSTGAAAER